MKRILVLTISGLCLISATLFAQKGNPIELGKVNWLRDFDTALKQAKEKEKPVFILFQEVPGCATCRNYGQNVLSHPLIVEAIENLFIPVAIYNNKRGKDAEVLKYYGEPSWNNPVVRIVGRDKKDIIPRVSGRYSQFGVVEAMKYALDLANQAIPAYLDLLHQELRAKTTGTEKATFSMYCFWTGEGQYGKMEGVVSTRPGFMHGREVVEVEYNPAIISYEELAKAGREVKCAGQAYAHNKIQLAKAQKLFGPSQTDMTTKFRQDKEPKYYLSRTHYRFVPMTVTQAARANSLVGQGKNPEAVLSPKQIALARLVKTQPNKKWNNVIGEDFVQAWDEVIED